MESENYNEEEWENLNDIEKALKAVGIQIRDTVDNFKDFDVVLSEIADKWDTFSTVQQSGIATSLAGTRQRENFLVLMENWDLVAKYSEISANASGTAAKKMEAYTDSIEAAQNRVTVAIEKWSEFFNGSELIKGFYNKVSYLIENIDTFSFVILSIVAIMNANSVWKTMVDATISFRTKMIDLATTFTKVKSNLQGTSFKTDKVGINNILNEQLIASQQQAYAASLNKYILSLDSLSKQNLINLQNEMLREPIENKKQIADLLLLDMTEEEATSKAKLILQNSKSELLQTLLNSLSETERKTKLQEIQKSQQCTEAEAELILATQQLAKQRKTQAGQAIGTNIKDSTTMGSASSMVWQGAGGIAGGLLGAYAGGGIGESLGGSTGQILGTTIGEIAGGSAVSSLIGTIASGTITAGSVAGPVGILFGLVGGAFYTMWKKHKQEMIEEAQQEFAELQSNFTEKLTASAQTIEYDELVKGVDSLGNNVSLTEEEYQKFLDTSNALAEAFPELVVRTDEAGNSFLGLNGKVGTITESVNELTDALQKQADISMLSEEVFGETLNADKEEKEQLEKQLLELEKEAEREKSKSTNSVFSENIQQKAREEYTKITKEIKLLKEQLENFSPDYSDYIQSIIRTNDSLSDSYEGLTDEQKQFVDLFSSSLDLTDMDYDEALSYVKDNLEEVFNDIDYLQDGLDLYFNMNTSSTASDYGLAREQLLEEILTNMPFLKQEDKERLLIKLGFTFDENSNEWKDTTNFLETIYFEGYDSKLKGISKEYLSTTYSIEDLSYAYDMLKNSSDNAIFSMENFNESLYNKKYGESTLSELANKYEELTDKDGPLNKVQEVQKEIIENQLDSWAKQLGVTKGDYDEIISKVKTIGDLTYGGVSTKSPEDVLNQGEDYKEFLEYLNNDYKGTWDANTLNSIMNYEDLLPYISNGDINGLKSKIKEFLGDIENEYEQTYQNLLYDNEEVTQQVLESNKELIDKFAENYNIDLNNFDTLKEAETWMNSYSVSLMTQDYDTWLQRMYEYYEDDLEKFTDAASAKMAINALILKDLQGMTTTDRYGNQVAVSESALQSMYYSSGEAAKGELTLEEYMAQQIMSLQAQKYSEQAKQDLQDIIDKVLPEGFKTTAGSISSDSGTSPDEDEWTEEDLLDAIESIIDKEWEAMQVFDELTGKVLGETAYFDKMEDVLNKKIALYKEMLAAEDLEESEYYDYQNKLIQAEVQLANLNDEKIEDEISLAEMRDYSLKTLIALQQEYLKTADTEEEAVERQKELNELIEQEYEERKRIREFEQDYMNTLLSRQSGTAWSDGDLYEKLIKLQKESYQESAEDALNRIEQYIQKYIGIYMEEGYSYQEAEELAKKTEEVQDATQEYISAIEAQAELVITKVADKLNEIDQKIQDLENSKPKTWTDIDQITEFAEKNIELLESKIPELEEALSDTSMLTDEQIQDLVNQLNDVTVALHEAQISLREEIQQYQESQFSALEWKVQQIIGELEDEMDKIDEAYEPILEDLENANKERERAIELEDLLANKLNATKEKERVYRQGRICP